MSLKRALDRLPSDRETENTVRSVLELLLIHRGSPMHTPEVARRAAASEHTVSAILSELARAYVISADGDAYSYSGDPLTDIEVQRFLKRADHHSQFVQSNVAKFRERYGYRS